MSQERGVTVVELMVVLVILGIMSAVGIRAMDRILEESSGKSLVTTVLALTNQARTLAVLRHVHTGLSFEDAPGGVVARVYRDGDGDGLSTQDIRRGIDPPEGGPVLLKMERAMIGLPDAVRTDPDGLPLADRDGIHFGQAGLLSFGPSGTATPGSLYIACGQSEAWAFRVSPVNGRIRIFRWRNGSWSPVEAH